MKEKERKPRLDQPLVIFVSSFLTFRLIQSSKETVCRMSLYLFSFCGRHYVSFDPLSISSSRSISFVFLVAAGRGKWFRNVGFSAGGYYFFLIQTGTHPPAEDFHPTFLPHESMDLIRQ